MSAQDKATLENIAQFLYREARFLDDEQWDEWIECYAPEASFWMPAWDDDDRLTEDPQSEISLIYYPDRQGLEDRVFRIKTHRQPCQTHAQATILPMLKLLSAMATKLLFALTGIP